MPQRTVLDMKRIGSLVAALVLCVGSSGSARATDVGPGCFVASYSRSASCLMVFKGFPVYIYADAASSGTTSIHAWVEIEVQGVDVPVAILDCTGTGPGSASCDKGLPNETGPQAGHYALEQFHMRCFVQSNGAGELVCRTADGA